MSTRLRIAIQKSGRLSEKSTQLLADCGIRYDINQRTLLASAEGLPVDILLLRDDDIPQYVEDQVAHLGIVGENVFAEMNKKINLLKRLGFSKCRMSLAIPKEKEYTGTSFFEGKSIATSYPNILSQYLQQKGVNSDIHQISGSVEIAPNIGLAEGIFDIVSTGGTLVSNGLKEVEIVLRSEAVLIANQNLTASQQAIVDELLFRIEAVIGAKGKKYVLLNAPAHQLEAIKDLLPGIKSPTVMPLAQENWVAIHAVMNETEFWEIIQPLKLLGAEDILVMPIEKIIP
jgi:ATP phosphoribosyltransferase